MKFRYYVTNTFDGCVVGTNSLEKAEALGACEEFFVVDAETGEWIVDDGERIQIEECK